MYLERERSKMLNTGKEFIQVEYLQDSEAFRIEFYYKNLHEKTFTKGDISQLLDLLPSKIDEIWINELVGYPNLYGVLKEIANYARIKHARLLYLLHDYFCVCPAINLLDLNGVYCDIPEHEQCQNCLENNSRFRDLNKDERKLGIKLWRENWKEFFSNCTQIRMFSDSSKKIFCRVYPDVNVELITVCPHKIDYLPQISGKKKFTKTFNIAVIGGISEAKGVNVVIEMARLIKEYDVSARLVIIGESSPVISDKLCLTIGKYTRNSLPTKILQYDVDMVLIPSILPETFSYTTQEAMAMGLPVACFDIGAPADRVKKYEEGIVIPRIDSQVALEKMIQHFEKSCLSEDYAVYKKILFIVERVDYASRLHAEHFCEEFMYHGVDAQIILLKEAIRKDLREFSAIIFYRCESAIGVSKMCRRAKLLNLKLYFDVDDLVFDADAIKSSGLSIDEKKHYLDVCANFIENIRLCDGITSSTQTLAKYLRKYFPDKKVFVRRNCASLEMETLSVCAGTNTIEQKDSTIYFAYFSGSWTHDRDFKIIEEPLKIIFEKYPNVKLQIYGCLHIPKLLKKFQNRIIMHDFTKDWRTLPEKIARAHIHLAPLENTAFNMCKSENKWLEAALTGRPTVASYNEELNIVIENGVTGFLCKTKEDWIRALSNLIDNPHIRNSLGKKAQEVVLKSRITRNCEDEALKYIADE